MWWAGIKHDWSKFAPIEFSAYRDYFYGGPWPEQHFGDQRNLFEDKYTKEWVNNNFNLAWLHHIHHNPHHYQYWILRNDDGKTTALEIPIRYAKEMICDWIGAGKALGKPNTSEWYLKNKDNIVLHPNTRKFVEQELGILDGS